ncbi:MAG TPA: sensor histidine kinase [Solirubrobacterales bacterium]|jgi:anti-sigma regulatory factor (Ser/Thr protein kinase)|nr:sensor histidine kinase [Solirubrobacterales bacterium]
MYWHGDTETGVRHEALFYSNTDELLAGALPFVEAGLEAGEAIRVAVPRASRLPLEDALGPLAGERLSFAKMEELGRNPARIIPAWRHFLEAAEREGVGARGIGEPIWAGRSQAELEECERHEALLNLAFAGAPRWTLMCPYNTELGDAVLDRAARNHPFLREGAEVACSGPYGPALSTRQVFAGGLEPPAETPAELPFDAAGLSRVRQVVAEFAAAVPLSSRRTEDVVLATNELATNSIRHGGGDGILRIWREPSGLVCEVRDRGLFSDPLVGRVRPEADQLGGRGLWIVNQTCDLVQIRSAAEAGSVVRLRASARP